MDSGNDAGMHGPTPILDRIKGFARTLMRGKPEKTMTEEVATPQLAGVRALWDGSVASGLTPERMGRVLRDAHRGDIRPFLELAEEMEERDPHYFAVLGTRKRALSRLKPSVEPASENAEDVRIADAVRGLVETPHFRMMLRDITDAFGKGFAVDEQVWRYDADGLWRPSFVRRDQKFFTFDAISRSELRLAVDGSIDGEALSAGKWIVHYPMLKSGNPIRGGLAYIVAWAFMFKNYGLKDWAAFLDVYGMPIRVGKYHSAATPEERRKLLQAVIQIASDAAAIIPESMVIELLEAKGASGGSTTPFEQLGRYLDEQISKAVLGQTMSTDNGGSLAQAQVHNQIRIDILEDDADMMGVTINRDVVAPFVAWNFGADKKPPTVCFPVAEPEDVASLTNALEKLVPLGLRVKMDEVREKIGFSEPDDDDEVLAPRAAKTATDVMQQRDKTRGAAEAEALNARRLLTGCPCCGETFPRHATALNAGAPSLQEAQTTNPLDALTIEGVSDWEAQLSPMVDAVLKAAEESDDFAAFAARLKTLAPQLDADALAARLANAQMKARGLGNG